MVCAHCIFQEVLRSRVLISDVCMSVAQGFLCEFCIDSESFWSERMSETPDISMDLLELEDAVPPPEIGSVFIEEEGEEESPREEDDVVWTPFLGPNPMTEVEFLFEDLFLVEVSHVVIEPLQQVLGSTVDAYKWTLVRHLDEVFRFKLLKRHFQFQLYITHDSTWQRVSYSSTIEEELNRFQERTRLARYCLRLKLNPGITPTNCGRP